MQIKKKKVSVIVPVYNAEKYIREMLDSILEQSFTDYEIIFVDNGSKDGSLSIMEEYRSRCESDGIGGLAGTAGDKMHDTGSTENSPVIRILKNAGKMVGAARNTGLEAAVGEYILFVDSDDYLPDKDILRKYVDAADQTGADLIVSNYARLWGKNVLPAQKHSAFSRFAPDTEEFRFRGFFSVGTLSYVWGRLYRAEFLREHQIRFEDLKYAEDKLFNMECYLNAARYVFLEDIGYMYRKNDTSISWQYNPDSASNWIKFAEMLKEKLPGTKREQGSEDMVWYTLLFASFFDGKMEYQEHKKSIRAVRRLLKQYREAPCGAEAVQMAAKFRTAKHLQQKIWRYGLWMYALAMKWKCYLLLSIGIKALVDLKVDERLSDTGIRKEQ